MTQVLRLMMGSFYHIHASRFNARLLSHLSAPRIAPLSLNLNLSLNLGLNLNLPFSRVRAPDYILCAPLW